MRGHADMALVVHKVGEPAKEQCVADAYCM